MKLATWPTYLALLSACALVASPAAAQHEHAASPYAHTRSDDLPTLTPQEVADLRSGEGMGLARPAELNHFPGPRHLLDLAADLALTETQIEDIEEIRRRMLSAAIAKGEEILTAERHLADLFASGSPTAAALERVTGHLGAMRGELQAIHLRAHIEAAALLSSEQIQAYDRLRGYGGA